MRPTYTKSPNLGWVCHKRGLPFGHGRTKAEALANARFNHARCIEAARERRRAAS